ncbi:MAG: folate-binding protein [Pseudomonadota bacterium]
MTTPDWNAWLESHPAAATWPAGQIGVALPALGWLVVSGADTETFLQGQLTLDLRTLEPDHSLLAAHCNPKGRVLALARLVRRHGEVWMALPAALLPGLLKRLKLYILRAKVQLRDAESEAVTAGFFGDTLPERLLELGGPRLDPDHPVAHWNDLTLIQLPGDRLRCLAVGDAAAMRILWQGLQATLLTETHWTLQDIRAGLPQVMAETVEAFVPQMLNLQCLGGIGFSKGCYIGQEIVARMQYLGTLKRRLFRARVVMDTAPLPGTPLTSLASQSGQGAGQVVSAAPDGEGGVELLAVVELAAQQAGEVCLATGLPLDFLPLPYAVPGGSFSPSL